MRPDAPAGAVTGGPVRPGRRAVVAALGLTQILAWGSSYYLPAVLAAPISSDTGWPLAFVVGGLSVGLLVAGLVSPLIGRAIEHRGGRMVLALGSVLLALGLGLLALSHDRALYLAAWLLIGAGMGAGLYDAAFATLGRLYGSGARGAITALTLYGGFASTICWPLSAFLVEQLGWRGACAVYAGLQLGVSLPIHLLVLPRGGPVRVDGASRADANAGGEQRLPARRYLPSLALLAVALTVTAAIASVVSVHLIAILQTRGVDLAAAVGLGALVGPSQVGARLVEMAFGRRYHPIWTMLASVMLIATGLALLPAGWPVLALALVFYGAGNGIGSIAKGTLPLALFGASNYASLMGRLALPSLLAQALSPALAALLLEARGPAFLLAVLTGIGLLNIGLVAALWRASGCPMPGWRPRSGDR